jgi:hypothetical protein
MSVDIMDIEEEVVMLALLHKRSCKEKSIKYISCKNLVCVGFTVFISASRRSGVSNS